MTTSATPATAGDEEGRPSADSILALLNVEIERLKEEQSAGGTNTWVLAASVAGLALFCAQTWTATIDADVLSKSLTVTAFVLYPAISWFWEIDTWSKLNRDPRRARIAVTVLRDQRTPLATMLALGVILFMVTWKARAHVNSVSSLLALSAIALSCTFALVGFGLTFSSLEIPGTEASGNTTTASIIFVVVAGWTLAALIGFMAALPRPFFPGHLAEAKLAVGLFALGLTVRLLAGLSHRDPIYWDLIKIRRDLLLGRVTLAVSRRQTELALLGLDQAARAEHWHHRAAEAHRNASQAVESFVAELNQLSESIGRSDGNLSLALAQIRKGQSGLAKRHRDARKALVGAYRAFKRFQKFPSEDVPEAVISDFRELRDGHSALYARYAQARRALREWSDVKTQLESTARSPKGTSTPNDASDQR